MFVTAITCCEGRWAVVMTKFVSPPYSAQVMFHPPARCPRLLYSTLQPAISIKSVKFLISLWKLSWMLHISESNEPVYKISLSSVLQIANMGHAHALQTCELDFSYPSDSIHERWNAGDAVQRSALYRFVLLNARPSYDCQY